MWPKVDTQAIKAFMLLNMFVIGIATLSGCIGQGEEGNTNTTSTGIPVTLTIQPNPMIPSRTTSYTLTDYQVHTSWANAIANDGNTTDYQWTDGAIYALDQIYWEWDVGYPDALKQLRYDVNISSLGPIYSHDFKIYKHDGGESTIFSLNTTKTTNGTRTWTALSDAHWIDGKVCAHYEFKEEQWGAFTYSVSFDVMILEFNQIIEEHLTTRQINQTEIYDILLFTVKQNDVDVTISGIPTNYQLIQIAPANSYRSVSNNIDVAGNLSIEGCSLGTYQVIFKSPKP
ncbi:MAG: hypothetical protein ACE5R6_14475 [Candidatus Heimdallarchaeota archaeon]